MKQSKLLVLFLLAGALSPTLFAPTLTAEENQPSPVAVDEKLLALQAATADREGIILDIINKLGPEAETRGYQHWESELSAALYGADAAVLLAAQSAGDYHAVLAALRGKSNKLAVLRGKSSKLEDYAAPAAYDLQAALVAPLALGSPDEDLTFTPLEPCRIVDTREGGGIIPGDSSRSFFARGVDLSAQGGGTCADLPVDASALALTVTVTGQLGNGFLTVFPEGTTLPLASSLNFKLGVPLANTTVTVANYLTGFDFQVYTRTTAHVVVDLLGVFYPLEVSPTSVTVSTTNSYTGTFDLTSPDCPAGTVFAGGGHNWATGSTDVWFWQVDKDGSNQRTSCRGIVNRGGASSNITCSAHCIGLE